MTDYDYRDRPSLFEPLGLDDVEPVRAALAADPTLIEKRVDDFTLLADAACRGHAELVRLLLSAGADPNARVSGHSILGLMAYEGHNGDGGYADVARLLINAGADVNAVSQRERPLDTALSWHGLLTDDNQPVEGREQILREFIEVLLENGAEATPRQPPPSPQVTAVQRASEGALLVAAAGFILLTLSVVVGDAVWFVLAGLGLCLTVVIVRKYRNNS